MWNYLVMHVSLNYKMCQKLFIRIYQAANSRPYFWQFHVFQRAYIGKYYGGQIPKNSIKKAKFTHDRVEYKVFLFDEPLKGSKSPKIIKINLTFRFDKL
jgi:hypothetical protein